jgi:hypothetical protein
MRTIWPFDDEHAPLYAVGQVAHMLDVQPAFIRRLDTEEVVMPARSDGGQRRRIIELEFQVAELKRQLAERIIDTKPVNVIA